MLQRSTNEPNEPPAERGWEYRLRGPQGARAAVLLLYRNEMDFERLGWEGSFAAIFFIATVAALELSTIASTDLYASFTSKNHNHPSHDD